MAAVFQLASHLVDLFACDYREVLVEFSNLLSNFFYTKNNEYPLELSPSVSIFCLQFSS